MLLARELRRLAGDLVGFALSGRVAVLLTVVVLGIGALIAVVVTSTGPVALYPFL